MRRTIFLVCMTISLSTFWGCTDKLTTDLLDSMVATYSVSETWMENKVSMSRPTFTMNVVKSFQNTDKILLNNFGNYGVGTTVEATAKDNSLTIIKQTLPNSRIVEGTGTSSDTGMDFTYTETQGTVSVTITATCKKL